MLENKDYKVRVSDLFSLGTPYRDRVLPGWREMEKSEREEAYNALDPTFREREFLLGSAKAMIPLLPCSIGMHYFSEEIGKLAYIMQNTIESFF